MRKIYLAALLGVGGFVQAQTVDMSFALDQMQSMPPYMSEFMKEYTRDLNENMNRSFWLNLQSTAEVMDTGDFEIGLLMGGGVLTTPNEVESNSPLFDNNNLNFSGPVPTLFNNVEGSELIFTFKDPKTGQPLMNPDNGQVVTFSMQMPNGLGLGVSAAPSAALSLGYGIGFGTEVRAYITPKFGALAQSFSDKASFSNDFAYGLSLKHEITTWIPGMLNRGWHISADVAYSSFTTSVSGDLLDAASFTADFSDDYSVIVNNGITGMDYAISTYGARLFLGKSFSWIDFSVYGGYITNSYSMKSVGSMEVTIQDNTGGGADESTTLSNMFDFDDSKSEFLFGGSTTIGKGWFRTSLNYSFATAHFGTLGFHFIF